MNRENETSSLYKKLLDSDTDKRSNISDDESSNGSFLKTVSICVLPSRSEFEVVLFPGIEPIAILHSVVLRTGLEANNFYLTLSELADSAIVPLSSHLPGGTKLYLHCYRSPKSSPVSADTSVSPQEGSSQEETKVSEFRSKKLSGLPIAGPQMNNLETRNSVVPSLAIEKEVCEMVRLSRLNTELANERTLLAWVRTCLAAIRTIVSELGISAISSEWEFTYIASYMLMAVLMMVMASTGYQRYSMLSKYVRLTNPPLHYGRVTVKYMVGVLFVCATAIFVCVCANIWE